MIIATAGHVDHGKTALIKALTGKDTDQLPEEQRRGLTIDLGFAWLHDPQLGPLAFVDVPGHARFIRTMLAGLAGADAALLVVAADEGPMPQTREHLTLLNLLGIASGRVVISKIDRASTDQLKATRQAVAELVQGSALAEHPPLELSSLTGEGMDTLQRAIQQLGQQAQPVDSSGHPRFLVDRRFSVTGTGCVITGTLLRGELHTGDYLSLTPDARKVRIRGMQQDGKAVIHLRAGQRAALNLVGELDTNNPLRGDWLLAPAMHQLTDRLDISLRLLKETRLHRGTLQILTGATAISGRVVWLDEPAGLAQVLLDQPVHAAVGDCVIVREPAANETLGGGRVIEPLGRQRGRSKPEYLARLAALRAVTSPTDALAIELEHQTELAIPAFGLRWHLTETELANSLSKMSVIRLGDQAIQPQRVAQAEQAVMSVLQQSHSEEPEQRGLSLDALLRRAALGMSQPSTGLLLKRMVDKQLLCQEGGIFALPGHQPQLAENDLRVWEQVAAELNQSGLRPPIVGELAERLGTSRDDMLAFMRRMQAWGYVLGVAPNRFYLPQQLDQLAAVAIDLANASEDGGFIAAEYRNKSGIGRNLTIQVLEYLDRAGVTWYRRQRRYLQPAWQRER
ncbi:selenocysteine-specific translation elongation factor [Pseudomonas sp. gcc21]|uniref:selenocysteine-specific translation elongation factor n=1 Tax=Pseudomonas sp. gcc21 TaxID=2726989 RepID=UPI00145250D8|nr:selenocysteine-specific translation elongation factor [Pseudomonas sp. gcc21]QJD58395.1 selenocysteine-specific translation elongation factor [Pseudomonas sp. gcc21]